MWFLALHQLAVTAYWSVGSVLFLLLKNFPAFYGTLEFITVFIRALHSSLS
jgi:hypothetical protein